MEGTQATKYGRYKTTFCFLFFAMVYGYDEMGTFIHSHKFFKPSSQHNTFLNFLDPFLENLNRFLHNT